MVPEHIPAMFGADPTIGFPSREDLHKSQVRAACASIDIRKHISYKLELYESEIKKLVNTWNAFEGPVKDANDFAVCIEMEEEGLFCWAHYRHGTVKVKVGEWEDVPEQKLRIVEKEPQRLKVKRIGRNDPCPCDSGKKYKRCCGRT